MTKKIKILVVSMVIFSGITASTYYIFSQKVETASADTNSTDDQAKQIVQDKMLNSIDNFKSARGSFRYYAKLDNVDNNTIDFDVKLNGKPVSYVKDTSKDGQYNVETTFDGDTRLSVDNKDKSYGESGVAKGDGKSPSKSAQHRYLKDKKGKRIGVILRQDPSEMGIASSVLYNQNVALGILEDYNKWNIDKEETFLGFPVTVISGELPEDYKPRFEGTSFKILMEKDTGIILSLEVYNDAKEVVAAITVNNIKVNSNYSATDEEKFKIKVPKGFKERKHM
jgi:hypothetical protein